MSGEVENKIWQGLRRRPTPGSGEAGVLEDVFKLIGREIDATNKRIDEIEKRLSDGDDPPGAFQTRYS